MEVDGVTQVEGWQFASGELMDERGSVIENITLLAPPAKAGWCSRSSWMDAGCGLTMFEKWR
jgi:hypothetical protein